jgi:hypothetical protein
MTESMGLGEEMGVNEGAVRANNWSMDWSINQSINQ